MKDERILIVDDDADMGLLLKDFLSKNGFEADAVVSGRTALVKIEETDYKVVITDIRMPDMDGLEVLRRVREVRPDTAVIMITAFATIDLAVEAMRAGAFHFVTKPFKMKEILAILRKAMEHQVLKRENILLKREVETIYSYGNIIGKSTAIKKVFDLIGRVAATTSNVLILGESGTGKELVAKAIHYNGPRRDKPFLPINCAAIPEGLLESELFGHIKGAFTGAIASRRGLFLESQGGTIFLDEIAEMGLGLQAKILRVLEDKEVRPVGGAEAEHVDVRIIAATQRDLREEISEGRFREDLYYRLNVIPINIPPLRERTEDIPLLAEHFLKKCSPTVNPIVKGFSKEAIANLIMHPWKGNVRELENLIERALVLASNPIIEVNNLPYEPSFNTPQLAQEAIEKEMTLQKLEEKYISEILKKTGGHKERAARILGINRRTLYRKEQRLNQEELKNRLNKNNN